MNSSLVVRRFVLTSFTLRGWANSSRPLQLHPTPYNSSWLHLTPSRRRFETGGTGLFNELRADVLWAKRPCYRYQMEEVSNSSSTPKYSPFTVSVGALCFSESPNGSSLSFCFFFVWSGANPKKPGKSTGGLRRTAVQFWRRERNRGTRGSRDGCYCFFLLFFNISKKGKCGSDSINAGGRWSQGLCLQRK